VPPTKAEKLENALVFNNLDNIIDEITLYSLLMKFGKIERIKVYDNRLTYESLGKALVEFESKEDALKCLKEYDQKEFMGHVLDVSFYYTNHKIVRKLANVIITNLDPEIT